MGKNKNHISHFVSQRGESWKDSPFLAANGINFMDNHERKTQIEKDRFHSGVD